MQNAAERANGTCTSSPSRVRPAATARLAPLTLALRAWDGDRPTLGVAIAAQEREAVGDEERGAERDDQLASTSS